MKKEGKRHHWSRSTIALAIWLAFGGVALTGWLIQTHPTADDLSLLGSYGSTSTTLQTITDVALDSSGQPESAPTPHSAAPLTNATISTRPATDPNVSIDTLSADQVSTLNGKQQGLTTTQQAQLDAKLPVTLTATQAKTLGVSTPSTATASATAKPVALDCGTSSNATVAHPFGCNLSSYIANLYQWALVIGAGLAVLMIMWAGYTYITSAGDPEAVRSAKDYLIGALIGLAILILTYTIYNTLRVGAPSGTAQTGSANGSAQAGNGSSSAGSGSSGTSSAADYSGTYKLSVDSVSSSLCSRRYNGITSPNMSFLMTVKQTSADVALSTDRPFGISMSGKLLGNNVQLSGNNMNGTATFDGITLSLSANINDQQTCLFTAHGSKTS